MKVTCATCVRGVAVRVRGYRLVCKRAESRFDSFNVPVDRTLYACKRGTRNVLSYRTCGGYVSSRALFDDALNNGIALCYCMNECSIASSNPYRAAIGVRGERRVVRVKRRVLSRAEWLLLVPVDNVNVRPRHAHPAISVAQISLTYSNIGARERNVRLALPDASQNQHSTVEEGLRGRSQRVISALPRLAAWPRLEMSLTQVL